VTGHEIGHNRVLWFSICWFQYGHFRLLLAIS
jgi:hypothetical protein